MISDPEAPTIVPAWPALWPQLETLFGANGACGGCWCMLGRVPRRAFEAGKGEANRRALHALIARGDPPGLLALRDGRAVGWVALGPRAAYPGFARSRVFRPVDDVAAWLVPCLFIARPWRRRGLSVRLLAAAAAHATRHGAPALDGCPLEPKSGKIADAFAWTGTVAAFRRAGFREITRQTPARPLMRRACADAGPDLDRALTAKPGSLSA